MDPMHPAYKSDRPGIAPDCGMELVPVYEDASVGDPGGGSAGPPAGTSGSYPFDPNAGGHGFVWHCHIIDHEDNEMMRPYAVTPKPGATRTYNQGTDY